MQGEEKQNVSYYRLVTLLVLIVVFVWGFTIFQLVVYVSTTQEHEEMLKGLTVERIDYRAFHQPVQIQ
ncbi:hypothetical protein MYX06_03105 [Patescibacteria group bacterium AH-259-L05]|nr:hypothetical protein [Patescibacteria group bacterium AH-259-L05]